MPDVFISYTQADDEWAERLAADLRALDPALDVYRDKERLVPGEGWRPQLTAALRDSKHLVVLWSSKSADLQKPWVGQELTYFERAIERGDTQLAEVRQRIIIVQLDLAQVPFSYLQQIPDLCKAGAYAGGLAALLASDPGLWKSVVSKVHHGLTGVREVPVPLLLLAATQAELSTVDWAKPPVYKHRADSLDKLVQDLGITRATLLGQYGAARTDWRPFGMAASVLTVLDRDRQAINVLPRAKPFRWDLLEEARLAGTEQEARQEIGRVLPPNPAVIVIDPVSLHVGAIYERFAMLKDQQGFNNGSAVVIVPAPIGFPPACLAYRSGLERLAVEIFEEYYQPGVRHIPHARCHVSFGDEYDLKRSVLEVVRSHFHSAEEKPKHAATTF